MCAGGIAWHPSREEPVGVLTTDDQGAQDGRALAGVLGDAVEDLRLVLDLLVRAEAGKVVSYPGKVRGVAMK